MKLLAVMVACLLISGCPKKQPKVMVKIAKIEPKCLQRIACKGTVRKTEKGIICDGRTLIIYACEKLP